MATGLKTQGTQLYKVATATTAVEIGNITSFNPPSPSSDELDITSLTSTAKEYLQGLRDYGEGTFELNWDPSTTGGTAPYHYALQVDFDAGTVREWMIGFSDGTATPTAPVSSSFPTPPTTRTYLKFTGFIKSMQQQGQTNNVVKQTLVIRCSGTPTLYQKA